MIMLQEETKAMAAKIEMVDGPNDEAARFANGGAYPPDLSLITKTLDMSKKMVLLKKVVAKVERARELTGAKNKRAIESYWSDGD
nr:hypothetical protein [Tanacetum cinerariifolium]